MRREPWVPDTRFGSWFQETRLWSRYVLDPTLETWAEILESRGLDLRGGHGLDAGCGAGLAISCLRERFRPRRLTAADIDPRVVAKASRAATGGGDVEVVRQDVQKLELPDASFDWICCHQTLHHVSDQRAALHEFHRVLKPGGLLLLAESCRRFTRSLWVWLLFRHPGASQRAPDDYPRLVREAGFDVSDAAIRLSTPFWSRSDFGLVERLSGRPPRPGEPTQVTLVARRLPDADS